MNRLINKAGSRLAEKSLKAAAVEAGKAWSMSRAGQIPLSTAIRTQLTVDAARVRRRLSSTARTLGSHRRALRRSALTLAALGTALAVASSFLPEE